jgi:hypothetical protein
MADHLVKTGEGDGGSELLRFEEHTSSKSEIATAKSAK